jgi:voltage-gated potassium channel
MELIVMVSVAERKWAYVKTHWMDIAIVVLPLVSFLRSLRILRATRLMRFARMQRLAQVLRVYRLRVTAMRLFRAFVVLEVFHRLFGVNPARRLVRLREELAHRQAEIDALHEKIAQMETLLAQQHAQQEEETAQANA